MSETVADQVFEADFSVSGNPPSWKFVANVGCLLKNSRRPSQVGRPTRFRAHTACNGNPPRDNITMDKRPVQGVPEGG